MRKLWVSGKIWLVGKANNRHANCVANLNIKNFTSPTPLNCVLKALIFALKDSADALVSLLSK